MLTYYFSIRQPRSSNLHRPDRPVRVPETRVSARVPPTPNVPPVYSLVELVRGPATASGCCFGDTLMIAGADPYVPTRPLWHVHTEAIRHTGDFLLVHAGAVRTPSGRGDAALPAQPESGKSTLTLGLVQAGFGYLSDEAAAIDPVTRMLHPVPEGHHHQARVVRPVPGARAPRRPPRQGVE